LQIGDYGFLQGRDMRKLIFLLLFTVSMPLCAGQISLDGLRLWAAPDHTRLVFDTSAEVSHTIFTLKKPDRLVIDIDNSKLQASVADLVKNDPLISNVRSGVRPGGGTRVVLDLKKAVKVKSFALRPNRDYGNRLVVDIMDAAAREKKQEKSIKNLNDGKRDVLIAIDAGHGGEDSGARGRYGTKEKDVVLAISKKLAALINQEEGMRAVLIRKGDYYLPLRKRTQLARDHKADLFISIHADAFRDRRAKGSSVYTLSHRGASSEAARWLAKRENSADLVGGVELKDKDDVLASVLLDLSQTATLQASHDVAGKVLGKLGRVGKTHRRSVQRAGFAVLKSPDVPSVLVETAFITNPGEEKKLKNPAHQQKLATSIMGGVRDYFHSNPPPGTLLAYNKRTQRRHVIHKGDTLAQIARRYDISLSQLRDVNAISGDTIQIGQVLHIPGT
jgi:N-acetylmuramoyl-L-alanine amidase